MAHFAREDPNNDYDIMLKLGKGSFGEVFKARAKASSEIVAIKVIGLDEQQDGQGTESIRREIQILRECQHKNIVRYYGSYIWQENLWVCLNWKCRLTFHELDYLDCNGILWGWVSQGFVYAYGTAAY